MTGTLTIDGKEYPISDVRIFVPQSGGKTTSAAVTYVPLEEMEPPSIFANDWTASSPEDIRNDIQEFARVMCGWYVDPYRGRDTVMDHASPLAMFIP